MHGGVTPRGIASHAWRGRGYSKDLPTRLADRFRRAVKDPQLLDLTSEVALIDARIGEVLSVLPETLSALDAEIWASLMRLIAERRKLVDSERRREETLQLHLTVPQALAFVSALQTAVAEVVTDIPTRRRLALRVEELLSRGTTEAVMLAAGRD